MATPNSYTGICFIIFTAFWLQACKNPESTDASSETIHKVAIDTLGAQIIANPDPYNDPALVGQYIRSIYHDTKGNYWFGPAGESTARFDGKNLHYFPKADFLQGNTLEQPDDYVSVFAITEDKKGNIWFGTNHGAVTYDGNAFRSYTEKNGLMNTQVGRKCILTDRSGVLWVGTQRGVYRYDEKTDGFIAFELLPAIEITDILEDKTGKLWFATKNEGVFRYDPQMPDGHEKAVINLAEKQGLGDNYAGGMLEDDAGNFWFTMKGGICKYDGENFTEITVEDGLGGAEIWGIAQEPSGIIWVTARGSTTRFNPLLPISDSEAFTIYTPEDGLNCCAQSMHLDRDGNMWWGTGQGLYRYDGTNFYQVKQDGPW